VTHPPENDATPAFRVPAWLRVAVVVLLGLVAPAVGRRIGRLVGDQGSGAAIAAGLYVALLVYTTAPRDRSRTRAVLTAIVGGAVVGGLFWFFSR
jgi:hypothetical protein